jgi:hypothetical protein
LQEELRRIAVGQSEGSLPERVSQIEVELRDGATAQARLVNAPANLRTELRLFYLTLRADQSLTPTAGPPHFALSVSAFRAYGADGALIERLEVAPAPGK